MPKANVRNPAPRRAGPELCGNLPHVSAPSLWPPASRGLGCRSPPLPPSPHPPLCARLPFMSDEGTATGWRALPNPGRSHLGVLTLFQIRSHSGVRVDMNLGDPLQPTACLHGIHPRDCQNECLRPVSLAPRSGPGRGLGRPISAAPSVQWGGRTAASVAWVLGWQAPGKVERNWGILGAFLLLSELCLPLPPAPWSGTSE